MTSERSCSAAGSPHPHPTAAWTAACHEAGHAVAAVLRGGNIRSVTIVPTTDYSGHTWWRGHAWDGPFISYAGPWAEARAAWPAHLPTDDDPEQADDAGCMFSDYVCAALAGAGCDDWVDVVNSVRRTQRALVQADPTFDVDLLANSEKVWRHELEEAWPLIVTLAGALLQHQVIDGDVAMRVLEPFLADQE